MIEDIIAAAIVAEGAPEARAMPIALRVKDTLVAAGISLDLPEAYVPKTYPKWVHGQVVHNEVAEAALVARMAPKVAAEPAIETKHYSDGTSATGPGPLPDLSPAQQEAAAQPVKPATAAELAAEPVKVEPAENPATSAATEPAAKPAEPAPPAA